MSDRLVDLEEGARMSTKFDSLPALILSTIYSHIQLESPETLRHLTLVNKTCYYIALPFLYQNLAIRICSRQKLRDLCAQIEDKSRAHSFLAYARFIKVWGSMPLSKDDDDSQRDDPERGNSERGYRERHDVQQYEAEFEGEFMGDHSEGTAEEVSAAWNPLASLISKFKHISDFVWVCHNQLPLTILKVIEEHHPSCRLHMRTFRLRTLTSFGVTDPAEQNLIQSPNLYSISVKVAKPDPLYVDYNTKAIYQVIALAPNLKHLVVWQLSIRFHLAKIRFMKERGRLPQDWVPQEAWKGFIPLLEDLNQGALESCVFENGDPDKLLELSRYTDLSKLRHLNIGSVSDPLAFTFMTRSASLASLETLTLGLKPTSHQDPDSLMSAFESLIESLKPLREIYLAGWLTHHLLDKILQWHGSTLRRLRLCPFEYHNYPHKPSLSTIQSEEIKKIESRCLLLESLDIWIPYPGVISLDDCSIADFCPELPCLRELELSIEDTDPNLPFQEVARKIWDLIHREGCCRLSRLYIHYREYLAILERKWPQSSGEVEVELVDELGAKATHLRYTRMYRGLPIAQFRF